MNDNAPAVIRMQQPGSELNISACDIGPDGSVWKISSTGFLFHNDIQFSDVQVPNPAVLKRFALSDDGTKILIFSDCSVFIFDINNKDLINFTDYIDDIQSTIDIQWSVLGKNSLIVLESKGSIYYIDLKGNTSTYMSINSPLCFSTCSDHNSWSMFSVIVGTSYQELQIISPYFPPSFRLTSDDYNALMKQIPAEDVEIISNRFKEDNGEYVTNDFGMPSETIPVDCHFDSTISSVVILDKLLYVSLENGETFIYDYPQILPASRRDEVKLNLRKTMKINSNSRLYKKGHAIYERNDNKYTKIQLTAPDDVNSRMEVIKAQKVKLQERQDGVARRRKALKSYPGPSLEVMRAKLLEYQQSLDDPPLKDDQVKEYHSLQNVLNQLKDLRTQVSNRN
ncbi:hypothetical protein TVAG_109390 [Trichomonas vaginalis G3]|uniref:Uncharacterized protein n=1 Tax=Trichomonas vaginalis (strain ATCC PRA-98 / G3) TaxID=412133 RepID=A2EAC8_TRIV3|nr:DPP6 N-terminal domain-like family [Trichomonas vaginalis G3]EAY10355.1 hypothetical protein TVAG_109390 [Trichomonas vaginalis G3]KAI5485362.1 DPP6 N-terminal domain-like family [Trichomonas vaginalis G3]|eukprot:XP_001322578.1 hypothetical protein [Trichomonas vaginalis G3]